jgi:hypothetical protein
LPRIVATTEDEGTNSAWADQPAPSIRSTKGRNYPILWKKYDDRVTAAAIVRAGERVVVKMMKGSWSLQDPKTGRKELIASRSTDGVLFHSGHKKKNSEDHGDVWTFDAER